jgi:hypothetical protein
MVTVVNRDVHGLVKEENQTKLSQTQNTDRLNQKLLAFNESRSSPFSTFSIFSITKVLEI